MRKLLKLSSTNHQSANEKHSMHVLVNQSVPSAVLMQSCTDISMVQAILRLPELQSVMECNKSVIRMVERLWTREKN